jgi:hypothetical protein
VAAEFFGEGKFRCKVEAGAPQPRSGRSGASSMLKRNEKASSTSVHVVLPVAALDSRRTYVLTYRRLLRDTWLQIRSRRDNFPARMQLRLFFQLHASFPVPATTHEIVLAFLQAVWSNACDIHTAKKWANWK